MRSGLLLCAMIALALGGEIPFGWCQNTPNPPVNPADTSVQDAHAREARLEREYAFLARAGVQPNPAAALTYLRTYIPARLSLAEAAALVNELGSDEYHLRETAAQRLIHTPNFPEELLKKAVESSDLEIRWRARLVLMQRGKRDWRLFQSALRVLLDQPAPGTLETLLDLAAFFPEESNQSLIHRVLAAAVREDDVPKLVQLREDEPVGKRFAAAVVLEKLQPEKSRDLLAKICEGPSPLFALHAAKRLGNLGDRRALPALVRLVGVEERYIGEESACFLRLLSRHEFHYPAQGGRAEVAALERELTQWLAAEGATAPLNFPVLESAIQRGDLGGNTLVATGTLGLVVELTPDGKVAWSYPSQAWSAEKLRKGTVLIASYQANQLLEVNSDGGVVWRMEGVNAMRAKPLADDHILVAHFSGSRVFELNAARQEVWTHPTPDNCFDAERMPNGNTVFACPNLVREITREGAIVHSLEVEGRVNGLQILPNGDWLVANYGKSQVQQYDRQGKLIWHFNEASPNDAYRLKNGNSLVTSAARCVEVDPSGRIVRTLRDTNYGCARQ